MEAAGLGVGVIGLVSLFNTCIDVVERWDSYKAFGLELGSLRARLNADRVRFRQWGEHVGIGEGKQGGHQHSALNDPSVRSAIDLILNSIKNIDNDARKAAPHLGDFSALTGLDLGVGNIAPDLILEKTSRRGRLGWALGGKARTLTLIGSFEALVQKLYDLIPPTSDTIKSDGATTSIEDALADLAKYIHNETQEVLRDWLDAPDAKRNYDDFVLRRLDGTCEWILGRPEFQQWQSFSPEHPNILWINGPPGYGKTILCARIVEHLLVNSQRNTAYFFFSSEIDGREDPYVVIRSWISQLVHQTQQAFNMAQGKWEASDGRTASKLDIKALFNDVIRNLPPSTFIVDGLDECADVDQRDILFNFLEFLTSIVSKSKSQLLVVSRNDYRIREGLGASNHDMKQIFTEFQIFPTHVIDDASAFSLDIIGRKLGNKSTTQQEELANKLVDRCEAMFLAIKLLEDDLRGGRNLKQLRRTIDQAPSKLDHIYDRNWERIQHLETDSKQRAFLILRWVTFAIRPLTVLEITECLLIPDTEDSEIDYEELPDVIDKIYINTEILELCNSLIEIRTEPNSDLCSSTIHLTHFSVRQYILCHMLSHGTNLVINEQLRASNESIHNNALAQTCLRYLTLDQTWKKLQPKKNSNTMIQAFRDYATNLWYHHVKRGVSNSAETIQQINAFFQFSNPKWDSWRKHSADFIQNSILSLEKEDPIGNPVLYASVLGLFETVDHLIEKEGLEVDLVGSSGTTALIAVSS
ncbi:putative NACHT nucleoside triphosphatase [Rosellinia necatrix]|uniref:Putative NACHT nucleoside triphosphatase n=1 Tax=Rosellinia necatrix TaxID=77044 RepID=A0A1S7UIB4_ROSNE|nr:putative NACHT nucleoside triphosphatase [Rosellinia necatrix]